MRHIWLSLLLAGCAPESNLESADTGSRDGEVAATPVFDTESCTWSYQEGEVDGILPSEVQAALAASAGPRDGTLEWLTTGERTAVTFELGEVTGYRIGTPVSGPACAAHVLVDLTLTLSTADGLLDEVLAVTVRGEGARVTLAHWLPLDALTGAWDPAGDEDSAWDSIDVEVAADIMAEESSGAITLYAVRTTEGRQDVSEIPVASWPPQHSVGR